MYIDVLLTIIALLLLLCWLALWTISQNQHGMDANRNQADVERLLELRGIKAALWLDLPGGMTSSAADLLGRIHKKLEV